MRGEQLIRLVEALRARGIDAPALVATEGWPPNVPWPPRTWAPYGILVRVYDPDTGARGCRSATRASRWCLNRHEAYSPTELSRVLRPGGRFLTQQVGSLDARETTDWFGARPRAE